MTAPTWMPIEAAPKDGSVVLLYSPAHDGCLTDHYCAGYFESFGPYGKEMGEDGRWMHELYGPPTHWMPLPAPPLDNPPSVDKP